MQHISRQMKKWEQTQLRMSVGLPNQGTDSDEPRNFTERKKGEIVWL